MPARPVAGEPAFSLLTLSSLPALSYRQTRSLIRSYALCPFSYSRANTRPTFAVAAFLPENKNDAPGRGHGKEVDGLKECQVQPGQVNMGRRG